MFEKKTLVISLVKSVFGKYLVYLVQFVSIIVLARIYSPEELGYFAVIQVFLSFFIILSDVGIAPAVINKSSMYEHEKNGLFSFVFIIGVVIAILFGLVGLYLDSWYDTEGYQLIALIVAVGIIFQSASSLPNAFLMRDRKFLHSSISMLVAELVSLFFLLVLEAYEPQVINMAYKFLLLSVCRFVLLMAFSRRTEFGMPNFGRYIKVVREYLSFSAYQFSFSLVNYFTRNLDSILIGKYFGFQALGYYDRAYQLMRYPLQLITFSLVPAIQPNVARMSDVEEVEDAVVWLSKYLSCFGVMAATFLWWGSEEIVLFLFGEVWRPTAELVKIFSLMIPVQVLMSSTGGFFQGLGRVKVLFYSGLVSALCNVAAIMLGVVYGSYLYVAKFLVVSFTINFIQTYMVLYVVVFRKRVWRFIFSLKYAVQILLVLVIFITILSRYAFFSGEGVILIGVKALIVSVAGIVFIYFFVYSSEKCGA